MANDIPPAAKPPRFPPLPGSLAASALDPDDATQALRDMVQDFRAFSILAIDAMDGGQLERYAFIRLFYVLSDSIEHRMAKCFPDEVREDGMVSL